MSNHKETFLSLVKSKKIRTKYIANFIDTKGTYYKNHILEDEDGYFWDCFISPNVIETSDLLKSPFIKKDVLVLWDKRSYNPFLHFNIEKVLKINMGVLLEESNKYTEDFYIFDDTYNWTFALTHETNDFGGRLYFEQKSVRLL